MDENAIAGKWIRPLWRVTVVVLAVCVAGCSSSNRSSGGKVQVRGERGPTFDVAQILAPRLVRGPGYIIERKVQVVGHDFLFMIQTEMGNIPALGRNMLELRLSEMYSIARAQEISKDPHILIGAVESVRNTGEGLRTLLTAPVGSAKRAPKGFSRMIRGKLDSANRRAGSPKRRKLAAQVRCGTGERAESKIGKVILHEFSQF